MVAAGVTRAVVQERLRVESRRRRRRGRLTTFTSMCWPSSAGTAAWAPGSSGVPRIRDADDWRIAGLTVLTTVRGLYRLSAESREAVHDRQPDAERRRFQLRVPQRLAFVAETDAGVTGIVILGRGEMTFSPTPPSEKGQVKIYGGGDTHDEPLRLGVPARAPGRVRPPSRRSTFHARDVDPRDLRRAEAVFQENLPRSFGIELADLSREKWSVIPKFGDLVAEMQTDRAHLTYMRSVNDPEDIRFFDRTRSARSRSTRRRRSSPRADRSSTKTTMPTSTSSTTTSTRASIPGANGSTARPRCW